MSADDIFDSWDETLEECPRELESYIQTTKPAFEYRQEVLQELSLSETYRIYEWHSDVVRYKVREMGGHITGVEVIDDSKLFCLTCVFKSAEDFAFLRGFITCLIENDGEALSNTYGRIKSLDRVIKSYRVVSEQLLQRLWKEYESLLTTAVHGRQTIRTEHLLGKLSTTKKYLEGLRTPGV